MGKQGKHRSILRRAVVGAGAAFFAAGAWPAVARAAFITTTWDGGTGDWFDPAHWSPAVPANDASNTYEADVNAGSASLNSTVTTSSFMLASPAVLTVGTGTTYSLIAGLTSSIAGVVNLTATSSFLDVRQNLTLTNATISGDGDYRQLGGSLVLAGASTISNLVLSGGRISGTGSLTITNHMDWLTSGVISGGTVVIAPTASLVASGNISFSGQSFINEGIAYLGVSPTGSATASTLTLSSPMTNTGTFIVEGTFAASGSLNNSGLITNYSSAILAPSRTLPSLINNSGTISGGFVITNGTNSGLLSPDAGPFARTLTLQGLMTLNPGSVIHSNGNGLVNATSTLTLNANVPADHLAFRWLNGTGTLTISGADSWAGGTVAAGANVLVPAAGQLTITSSVLNSGSVINNGTVYGGTNPGQAFNLGGTGTFTNNGTFYDELSLVAGNFVNNGLITTFTGTAGTRNIAATVINNGTISGPFTLFAGFVNNGMLSGDTPLGGTTLTLTNFTFNPAGVISSVAGSVSATGTLYLVGDDHADHLTFANLAGPGTLDLTGPNLANGGNASSGAFIHVQPTGSLSLAAVASSGFYIEDANILNEGVVTESSSVEAFIYPNSSVDNRGTINLSGQGMGFGGGPGVAAGGPLLNSGLITASGTVTLSNLVNTGTISATGNTPILVASGSSTGGTFTATSAGGILFGTSQGAYILDNSSLSGGGGFYGSVTLLGGNSAASANFDSINGPGNLDVSGLMGMGDAAPGATGTTQITGATVRILPTGALFYRTNANLQNLLILNNATLSHEGNTTTARGTITLRQGSVFANSGFFSNNARLLITDDDVGNVNLGTFINSGTLSASQPVVFANFSTDTYVNFTNSGLITCSSTQANFTMGPECNFVNSGTVTVSSFNFLFASGTGSGSTGVISILSSPGSVSLTGGFLLNNATLLGVGFSGSVTLAGTSNAQSVAFTGISGAGALNISQTLGAGSTPLTISGGAHVTLQAGGTTQIIPSGPNAGMNLTSGTFTNAGLFDFSSASSGTIISFAHGGVFENQGLFKGTPPGGGTYTFAGDGDPANLFNNSGTVTITPVFGVTFNVPVLNTGSMTLSGINTQFNSPFYNAGTFTAQGLNAAPATITFAGGGSASGFFNTLPASNGFPASIVFSAPFTLNNATLAGNFTNTAPLTLIGPVSATWTISGDLVGAGTLSGSLSWRAGAISNAGGLQISSASPGQFASGVIANGIPIYTGDFTIQQAGIGGSTKTPDGINLVIPSGYSAAWSPSVFPPPPSDSIALKNGSQIVNNGTFYTFMQNIAINSADNNAAEAFINHGIFGRSSTLVLTNSPAITTITVPFHNAGLVDIQQGSIDFAGGYFNDGGGTIQFAPGAGLSFSGGSYDLGTAPFDLGAGGLSGTGTVHGNFTSDGIISPGHSPGALTIDGDLHLQPDASTDIELAGTTPGSQFDTLTVTGTLDLAGDLNLTLLNGYLPGESDSFQFLTAGTLDGTFLNAPDGARFPDSGSQGTFLVTYTSNAITLSDFQAAVPEPLSLAWLSPTILLLLRRNRRASGAWGSSYSPAIPPPLRSSAS